MSSSPAVCAPGVQPARSDDGAVPPAAEAARIGRKRSDPFTDARSGRNPCGFAARINDIALWYNTPLYGWVEERFGLSRVEFVVIYSLALHDSITATDIATSSAFPKNTLSRAINRLVEQGYVTRVADGDDRRMQLLSLTGPGRAIFDAALPRFVKAEQDMLAPLTLVEREMLALLLTKIVGGLSGVVEDGAEPRSAPDA